MSSNVSLRRRIQLLGSITPYRVRPRGNRPKPYASPQPNIVWSDRNAVLHTRPFLNAAGNIHNFVVHHAWGSQRDAFRAACHHDGASDVRDADHRRANIGTHVYTDSSRDERDSCAERDGHRWGNAHSERYVYPADFDHANNGAFSHSAGRCTGPSGMRRCV